MLFHIESGGKVKAYHFERKYGDTVSVYLPIDIIGKLNGLVDETGLKRSRLVRLIIQSFFESNGKWLEDCMGKGKKEVDLEEFCS